MEGWLDQNSLARFVVEIVEQLDTSAIERAYRGGGSAPYAPKMMLALLFYSYAKGIFSSRKIEQATYELIPVLYLTGGLHPDHDSINTFRQRFLGQLSPLFVEILEYACGLGIFKLGDISIDGVKIKANASKHKAMSWDYAWHMEQQLQEEVATLLAKAESENGQGEPEIDIPQEPQPGPQSTNQINFTDSESRIMPVSGGGFEQAYNAQASVDMKTMLIVGNHVSQQPNDKQEVEPALAQLNQLPESLGKVEKAALDSGFFSEHNTKCFEAKGIEPYISSGRHSHNLSLEERLAPPPSPPINPDGVVAMEHRLKTEAGKQFYGQRKSTVEPVFGIIKEVMGFRRFMLRGFETVTGEWTLVCIAFNLKRLCRLSVLKIRN